jgi:membrane protein required for colicin V production
MNLLDYVIIVAMISLIIQGIMRGIIREVCSLVGIILGILIGNLLQPWLTDLLRPSLPSTEYLPLISFAFIFAVILILCNLIGWLINLLSKRIFLRWLDRTLGGCLAVAKGIIITYLVIIIVTFFVPAKTPLIAGSKLAPWVIRSYQYMTSIISPDHYQNWKKRILGEDKKTDERVSGEVINLAQYHE